MLDVIVMRSIDTPAPLVANCLESIKIAQSKAAYPINVIVHDGVMGHLGEGMTMGLARSTNRYVCWVDDDDYLLPHAFTAIENALFNLPPALCARELSLYANGHLAHCDQRHHLTVYRTSWVKQFDLSPFKATPRVFLLKKLPPDTVDVMVWVYVHRERLSGGMKLLGKHLQAESLLWR